jgi:hypothetical protein
MLLLAVVLLDWIQVADPDLWMHIRFGQIVLHSGRIPRHDIFSYSAAGAPWFNHEWLSDVVFAWCYDLAGIAGLKLLKFLCASATVVLLAIGIDQTGADTTAATGCLMVTAVGLYSQTQFRPQLFDYVFLSALLVMLGRESSRRGSRELWCAVPMLALWANLHGSFFAGVAVLAVYAIVTGGQDLASGRGGARLLHLSGVATAALLATLLNPFGIRAWYVAAAKLHEPIIALHLNAEFQSMSDLFARQGILHGLNTCGFPLLMALVGIAAFCLTPRRDDLGLVAVALMMTCASVFEIRHVAFAVIAWSAPLARHLHMAFARTTEARDCGRGQIVLGGLAGALAVAGGFFSPRLPTFQPYPAGAIAFMERHGLRGNVLTEYVWGGYVIWHESPQSRVFFDTFDERYPGSVQTAYLEFMDGNRAESDRILKQYPSDYVLLPVKSRETDEMMNRRNWSLAYRDPVAVLFVRVHGASSQTAAEISTAAPTSFFP